VILSGVDSRLISILSEKINLLLSAINIFSNCLRLNTPGVPHPKYIVEICLFLSSSPLRKGIIGEFLLVSDVQIFFISLHKKSTYFAIWRFCIFQTLANLQ